MIYHCCGDCGERWLIGNPRTCKCPEEKPQREFVGLTDEQISDLWCKVSNTDFVTADTHVFARAIEAKLRSKNNG